TGSNSIYFNDAVTNPQSQYKEWYQFKNYPNEYDCWWGIKTLPNVNEMTPSYIDYIITGEDSVIKYWLDAGAGGFRLDVADELPDEFIYLLRKRVKEINPEAIVIGEVWEDASNKESYGVRRRYFTGPELDTVMNYPFKNSILDYVSNNISGEQFSKNIMTIVENYPKDSVDCLMNSISTHDTVRALTFLGNQKELLKTAMFLQFVLPGITCIYYGDEIGMEGGRDPFNRGYFKWDCIDNDLLSYVKSLAEIKNKYTQLQTGNVNVYCEDDVLYIKRDNLLCMVNGKADGETIFNYRGLIIKWTD
ncbi:MAG: glycoside hydrolase family 13 protein, partial [Clostridia bacterium]|nr:glycoside hydrolase family 13 protein [Clostridia bacterium]